MTLPRACAIFGSLMGGILLSLVGIFSWAGISRGMVWPAAAAAAKSHNQRLLDYSGLVRHYLGDSAVHVFNSFLIANALGFAVMYCDISADVLLGSEGKGGVLPEIFALVKIPDVVIQWVVYRPVFLAVFIFLFVSLCPLFSLPPCSEDHCSGLASVVKKGDGCPWLSQRHRPGCPSSLWNHTNRTSYRSIVSRPSLPPPSPPRLDTAGCSWLLFPLAGSNVYPACFINRRWLPAEYHATGSNDATLLFKNEAR